MAKSLKFQIKELRDCSFYVAKTKALFSCVVTTHLICAFVFAYAKIGFFHDSAHKVFS